MHEFGWGDSACVREALVEYNGPWNTNSLEIIQGMGYPPEEGDNHLIRLTRDFAHQYFFSNFNHIVICAGAHHGMATILRAFRHEYNTVHVAPRYFSFYPKLINKEGYEFNPGIKAINSKTLKVIDSPSNPEGRVMDHLCVFPNNVLWDGVYNNRIFCKNPHINPGKSSRFFIGSFSKFFGTNGIRLGWVGCNIEEDYNLIKEEIVNDTLGISVPSQLLARTLLLDVNINFFMSRAAHKIDCNREQFRRLEYLFEPSKVPENGMFYLASADALSRQVLTKAGVRYIDGEECGAPDHVRFNMAQKNQLTKDMVDAVIKVDTIR